MNSDLLDVLIGGIIGLGGAIGRDIINQWHTRPRVSVCEETLEVKIDYGSGPESAVRPREFIATKMSAK